MQPTPDLPLPVVPRPSPTTEKTRIKPSKMGPRRAAVLILIHLVIIAHIIQWLTSGMSDGLRQTLSPVEPSESMFTLETGRVNAGYAFFAATLAVLALGAHGGVMNYHLHRGTLADSAITTPRQVVFTQGYKPTPADQAAATAAINHLTMLRPFNQGGISLLEQWGPLVRLSWLYSVAGDFTRAEDALTRALMLREPNDQLVAGLLQFHTLRQATTAQTQATLTKLMHRWHGTEPLRRALATTYLQANQPQQARHLFEAGLKEHPRDIPTIRSAANLMLALGDIPAGVTILRQGLVERPTSPDLQEDLAGLLLQLNNADEALQLLTQAAKHDPTMTRWYKLAELTSAMGRRDESATALTRARELEIDQIKRAQARAVEADANQTLARLAARSKASQTRHQP